MAEKTTAVWKRVVAYAAFSVVALVAMFFLTFPYDALKDRLKSEAGRQGYDLRMSSLGPGFFSVKAKGVEIAKKSSDDVPQDGLRIDSLAVGPTLFPPGLKVSAQMLGGSVVVGIGGLSANRIKLDADSLDLTKGNIKGFTGVDLAGSVSAHFDLTVPKNTAAPAEPDLSQANGTFSLETKGLVINGGTLTIPIAQFGPEPTPVDLPKIMLGDISGKIAIEKGVGTVSDFTGRSPDLELQVSGTLTLAGKISSGALRGIEYSQPNMEVRFKPDPEFQKRLGMIGSALSMVGADPKDPSWRKGNLTGYLNRPKFPN